MPEVISFVPLLCCFSEHVLKPTEKRTESKSSQSIFKPSSQSLEEGGWNHINSSSETSGRVLLEYTAPFLQFRILTLRNRASTSSQQIWLKSLCLIYRKIPRGKNSGFVCKTWARGSVWQTQALDHKGMASASSPATYCLRCLSSQASDYWSAKQGKHPRVLAKA